MKTRAALVLSIAVAICIGMLYYVCIKKAVVKQVDASIIIAIERERDSIHALYKEKQASYQLIEKELAEREKEIERIKLQTRLIEYALNKRLADLKLKTPAQVHEIFDSVYPTTLKGPVHNIVSDQAMQAVAAKIELEYTKEELALAYDHIGELNKMVSLQASAILIKDEQLTLQAKEITIIDKGYRSIIQQLESDLARKEKRQRIERATAIGITGGLLVLLIFN